jgi:hypothetical protein
MQQKENLNRLRQVTLQTNDYDLNPTLLTGQGGATLLGYNGNSLAQASRLPCCCGRERTTFLQSNLLGFLALSVTGNN